MLPLILISKSDLFFQCLAGRSPHWNGSDFSTILAGDPLLQEFITDALVVVKRGRLLFVQLHQDDLQAASYHKLVDLLENESPLNCQQIILPSTFIGGPCSMAQLYQDAMAITRKFGPLSLFITLTANPKWPEIVAAIPPGAVAYNHPTIVARVFAIKVKAL
jgi:hypothetical protein